jgi:hypothetical protein
MISKEYTQLVVGNNLMTLIIGAACGATWAALQVSRPAHSCCPRQSSKLGMEALAQHIGGPKFGSSYSLH